MLATTLIESLFERGIRIWTDGENLKAAPSSALTDDDRQRIKYYKTELLWRIDHPEGDHDPFVKGGSCPSCGEALAVVEVEPHRRLDTWEKVECSRSCGSWYRKKFREF